MPLTLEAIAELKEIYRSEFGESLPDSEAWEMGHRLIRLFDVLTRPEAERAGILRSSTRVRFDPKPGSR